MESLVRAATALERMVEPDLVSLGGVVSGVSKQSVKLQGLSKRVSTGSVLKLGAEIFGEVVSVDRAAAVVVPYDSTIEVMVGTALYPGRMQEHEISEAWLGRAFDALGHPIDNLPMPIGEPSSEARRAAGQKVSALSRSSVEKPLQTGVRAIDIFTPICHGQRLGIFAGSGVGKSTLLSMLAKSDAFDVVVIALVGERSREVREFLETTLNAEGRNKTIAIVATGDDGPLLRRRAPEFAMSVCEHFSSLGQSVLLLVDSMTRYAQALREIGIASGEPPVARGYPPSVFSQLPVLLERAGPGANGFGDITLLSTVLVDGDDHNDPVADCVRGIVDGHIVLDRDIAEEGRYPAINPLSSISRLSQKVWTADERDLVLQLCKLIARYEDSKDIRLMGGWRPGQDPELDKAVETVPVVYDVLHQSGADDQTGGAFDYLAAQLKAAQMGTASDVATE